MSTGNRSGNITVSTFLWGILAIVGGIIWIFFINGQEYQRAWRALLVNFTFFTSLTGGLVVWPAVVRQCNGRWHAGVERLAAAGIVFAVPSILAMILLWIGSPKWAPWYHAEFPQGVWLNNSFIFGRNLAGLVLFWGLAARYLTDRGRGRGRISGGWLIVVYSLVFSLLGFDLIMALDPEWYSTMLGGYFFMSGLYIAIAGWALAAAWSGAAREEQLLDLGRLVVAFSLMTTYLMYAHLLPMWYENLPHEVRFLVRRMNFQPWLSVSYLLLGSVYLGPLVLLLTERSKRNRWSLGIISLYVLAGMWIERWWLITPTFAPTLQFGLIELSVAAACIGLLGLGFQQFNRRLPHEFLHAEQKE